MSLTVACPNCKRPVPWGPQSPFRPFCCERCRLIDLGEWFNESHRIPGPPQDDRDDNWIDKDGADDDPDAANAVPRSLPH